MSNQVSYSGQTVQVVGDKEQAKADPNIQDNYN